MAFWRVAPIRHQRTSVRGTDSTMWKRSGYVKRVRDGAKTPLGERCRSLIAMIGCEISLCVDMRHAAVSDQLLESDS